jgi:hypothetical protein
MQQTCRIVLKKKSFPKKKWCYFEKKTKEKRDAKIALFKKKSK